MAELTLQMAGTGPEDASAVAIREVTAGTADPVVAALVGQAREGDRDAFAALVDMYQTAAWRVAMAALGRPEEAEDAAQDGFISAWRNLGHLKEDASFRPWLLSIVWRKALDRRRGLRKWLQFALPSRACDERAWTIDDAPDLAATPEAEAIGRAEAAVLRQLIGALPSTLRDALLLASSGDYRYDEIAGMLGIPVGTLKWRVSKARRILQEKRARLTEARS